MTVDFLSQVRPWSVERMTDMLSPRWSSEFLCTKNSSKKFSRSPFLPTRIWFPIVPFWELRS
jgi:hypothetical protein